MGKTGSYIKLDRGLKKNSLWLEKPFSKGQAWVDLLLLAQGVDIEKHYRGVIQHQEPGTVYTSILFLTNRWGWSRNKVYRFLKMLEEAEMISFVCQKPSDTVGGTIKRTQNGTYNGTTNGTIISIVNWEVYQYCETNNDTKDETRNDTTKRTPNGTHNRKHIRESNKEKAKRIPPKSPTGGESTFVEKYPCGLLEKPEWMDESQWKSARLLTADDIPGTHRGDYDDVIEYLHDKQMGCLR